MVKWNHRSGNDSSKPEETTDLPGLRGNPVTDASAAQLANLTNLEGLTLEKPGLPIKQSK